MKDVVTRASVFTCRLCMNVLIFMQQKYILASNLSFSESSAAGSLFTDERQIKIGLRPE